MILKLLSSIKLHTMIGLPNVRYSNCIRVVPLAFQCYSIKQARFAEGLKSLQGHGFAVGGVHRKIRKDPEGLTHEAGADNADVIIDEIDYDPALANSVMLIGTVGSKPEVRFFESGNKVATIPIAINSKKDEDSQWIDVEAWGSLADRAQSEVDKGQRIAVQGRLRVNSWTDGQGMRRKTVRISANTIKKIRSNYNQQTLDASWEGWPSSSAPQQLASPQQYGVGGPHQQTSAPTLPTTTEDLWMSYFESPDTWHDNRERKQQGSINTKSPDFKRKDGGRDAPALWIDSRTTPAWVSTELRKLDSQRRASSDLPPF
jgi:single-strand DNA-binding protein